MNWIICDVDIGINATTLPDRIALDISPETRVVIAEIVVVQPGLAIEILPREALVHRRRQRQMAHHEGIGGAAVPDHGLGRIRHLLRRAEVIGMDEIDAERGDERDRRVAEENILALHGAGAVALGDEMPGAVVLEMNRPGANRDFAHPLAEIVQRIVRLRCAVERGLHHPIVVVVGVGEDRARAEIILQRVAVRGVADVPDRRALRDALQLVAARRIGIGLGDAAARAR